MAESKARVLVVGGTGHVGSQVVRELIQAGHSVRALVRPQSSAENIDWPNVTIVRGDMMEPSSLSAAFDGIDYVVNCAAGYTKRKRGDSAATDTQGNRNLVDAARGVKLFILCSILTCDKAEDVPHFHHKKLLEDYLEEKEVPFVSIRPGAFLDQSQDILADGIRAGAIVAFSYKPITYTYTADLAKYLAAAVDLDAKKPGCLTGKVIDVGMEPPLGATDLAATISGVMSSPVRVSHVKTSLFRAALFVGSAVSQQAADLRAMFQYFETGQYVADYSQQQAMFGSVPSAESTIRRYLSAKKLTNARQGRTRWSRVLLGVGVLGALVGVALWRAPEPTWKLVNRVSEALWQKSRGTTA